jgi:hypothetical protein
VDLRLASLFSCVALAVAAGCYTGSPVDINDPPFNTVDPTEPHDDGHDAGHAPEDTVEKATGLPCDIARLVHDSCIDCHGTHPDDGVDIQLITYENFTAEHDHGGMQHTVADLALTRMRSPDKPMPPDERLDPSDIAMFEKWIQAGLPRGSCDNTETYAGDPMNDAGHSAMDMGR